MSAPDQSLADAIVAAHRAVLDAEEERNRLLRLARERGASLRDIADLLPVTFNTVFRWSGGARNSEWRSVLDEPFDEQIRLASDEVGGTDA